MDRSAKSAGEGRIERLFETLQDRLVKEMRLAGIDSIEAANHFLETRFLPEWEERFTVAPRNPRNAHRRLGREHHLEEILSVRVFARWPTITRSAGMETVGVCPGKRSARAYGERRWKSTATGRLSLVALPNRYLRLRHCPEPPPRAVSPSGLRPPGLTANQL